MKTIHKIIDTKWLAPNNRRLVVFAPHVVQHCGPGQFVIVRVSPEGERIPLTIAGSDRQAGSIVLIVQAVGATTHRLCALNKGDNLSDVAGPLGRRTDLKYFGHTVLVGGGVGTAVVYPLAMALKAEGNYVSAIIGARSQDHIILENELAEICDDVYPCTDDGKYGFAGLVTDQLRELIERSHYRINAVFAAGPVRMMGAVAELTRGYEIPTIVSLNPIMVDGTGMCGGCRVQVGGQMRFACVDGPEFDAHQVDFQELADRLSAYRVQEQAANDREVHRVHRHEV